MTHFAFLQQQLYCQRCSHHIHNRSCQQGIIIINPFPPPTVFFVLGTAVNLPVLLR
jgi:hypothetical protein